MRSQTICDQPIHVLQRIVGSSSLWTWRTSGWGTLAARMRKPGNLAPIRYSVSGLVSLSCSECCGSGALIVDTRAALRTRSGGGANRRVLRPEHPPLICVNKPYNIRVRTHSGEGHCHCIIELAAIRRYLRGLLYYCVITSCGLLRTTAIVCWG